MIRGNTVDVFNQGQDGAKLSHGDVLPITDKVSALLLMFQKILFSSRYVNFVFTVVA